MSAIERTTYHPHTAEASITPITISRSSVMARSSIARSSCSRSPCGDLCEWRARWVPRGGHAKSREFRAFADVSTAKRPTRRGMLRARRARPRDAIPTAGESCGGSDHPIPAEILDLRRGVAGLTENLVGVLAERRRLTLDPGAAVRKTEARADEPH